MINLGDFSGYRMMDDAARQVLASAATDDFMNLVVATLFHGKFYTVFALLFGLGIALQIERGASNARLLRRYFWLFVFGIVHMWLIWPGDILAPYALLGMIALLATRWPRPALLVAAFGLIALPILLHWLIVHLGVDPRASITAIVDGVAVGADGHRSFALSNLMNPLQRLGNMLGDSRMPKILGVFLLGIWTGRTGIHREPVRYRRLFAGLIAVGILVGLPASLYFERLAQDVYFPATALGQRQTIFYALGVVPMGLAWASGFTMLWLRDRWRPLLAIFAPAGRMALTNYLMQSVICAVIFVMTQSGVIATLGPTLWPPVAATILGVQIVASKYWLARHRFGPLEAVWRRLTYGRA